MLGRLTSSVRAIHRLGLPVVQHQRLFSTMSAFRSKSATCDCSGLSVGADPLLGSVQYYNRHVLVATSVPAYEWPSHFEKLTPTASDPQSLQLISRFEAEIKSQKRGRAGSPPATDSAAAAMVVVPRVTAFDISDQSAGAGGGGGAGSRNRVLPGRTSAGHSNSPAANSIGASSGAMRFTDGDILLYPDMICIRRCNSVDEPLSASVRNDRMIQSALFDRSFDLQTVSSQWRHRLNGRDRFMFVCTHNSRDARCGTCGPPILDAIRSDKKSFPDTYAFGCSHIGGHRHAPNVLCYPTGDWFGHVASSNQLKELIARVPPRLPKPNDPAQQQLSLPAEWRGRIGLTETDQKLYTTTRGPTPTPTPVAASQ